MDIFDTLNIKNSQFEMKISEHCRRMFACDLTNSKHIELALFSCSIWHLKDICIICKVLFDPILFQHLKILFNKKYFQILHCNEITAVPIY